MRRLLYILCAAMLVCLSATGHAQSFGEDRSDKGFLTRLLEDSLGGDGRTVTIDGFAGALSSQATIKSIRIADTQGIWLEMQNLSMIWDRRALLRGRIDITELSAKQVRLARLPEAQPETGPSPEASTFALPDLPVSVEIKKLDITEIQLGEPVLGEPAQMSLTASAKLADGSGAAQLTADRTDDKRGQFIVDASFNGADDLVDLKLQLTEAENGIAARILDLRGRPSVNLKIDGTGPVTDLTTNIVLQTDGSDRLSGTIITRGTDDDGLAFGVDIAGDLAPLFPTAYGVFLGDRVELSAEGARKGDGALDLSDFRLRTGASDLKGALKLDDSGQPLRVDIDGDVAAPDGSPLPFGSGTTTVNRLGLTVDYDAARSEEWTARFRLTDLSDAQLSLDAATIDAQGRLTGPDAETFGFDGTVKMNAAGLALTDPALSRAAGDALSGSFAIRYGAGSPLRISALRISGADYGLSGDVDVAGLEDAFETTLDLELEAESLTRFSDLAGLELGGAATLSIAGTVAAGGAFDLVLAGDGNGLRAGIAQVDPLFSGRTALRIAAVRDENGTRLPSATLRNANLDITGSAVLATDASEAQFDLSLPDASLVDPALDGPLNLQGSARQDRAGWSMTANAAGPFGASAEVEGRVTGPRPTLAFDAKLPDIAVFVPQYSGPARLTGTASQQPDGWHLDTSVSAPFGVNGEVIGRVTGDAAPDVTFELSTPDVRPFVPSVSGPLSVSGRAQGGADGIAVQTEFSGPYRSQGALQGRVTGQAAPDVRFEVSLPNMQPLVPTVTGALSLSGSAISGADGISVNTEFRGPYASQGSLRGRVTGDAPSVRYRVRIPDIARAGAPISGPLSLDGSAQQSGARWLIDTDVQGPGGTVAQVNGSAGADVINMAATGTAPLGLTAPFIRPRSLSGLARFDLRLDAPPSLQSLSGTVQVDGARFAAPNLRVALENINSQIALNRGQAQIELTGTVSSGGQVRVNGGVGLDAGNPADLSITLEDLRLIDPELYEALASGQLSVSGPLSTGAAITGTVNVNQVEIQVPSSQVVGFSTIPDITHVSPGRDVRLTLQRAGLDAASRASETSSASTGVAHALDVRVNAPARLFVRGRGLDAELGGTLRVTGTTANIISAGQFNLVRGRLDLLGKRFLLDEGNVVLQGRLDPFLRFVASTNTDTGTASIVIEGPASEPNVRFLSNPAAPEDEVLAQIFFGRSASQLSPFQTLQLANAVATLAGRGGGGVLSDLRLRFNLDDLDVSTDEDGNVGLRVGKYLSDNVYTDVLVGDRSDAGVSLNIDLTPSLTARGTLESDGDSSIGIFFERDY